MMVHDFRNFSGPENWCLVNVKLFIILYNVNYGSCSRPGEINPRRAWSKFINFCHCLVPVPDSDSISSAKISTDFIVACEKVVYKSQSSEYYGPVLVERPLECCELRPFKAECKVVWMRVSTSKSKVMDLNQKTVDCPCQVAALSKVCISSVEKMKSEIHI